MERHNDKPTYMSLFPIELLIELALFIPYEKLLELLKTLPQFSKLITSNVFWKQIWKRDISSYLPPPENPYQKYIELSNLSGSTFVQINYLAANGYDILLEPLLMTKLDYDNALTSASLGGQLPIVKVMISKKGTSLNTALAYATRRNHEDIIDFLIKSGATDLNNALGNAAENGNIHLVKKFIDLGANDYRSAEDWARTGGHPEIIPIIRKYYM